MPNGRDLKTFEDLWFRVFFNLCFHSDMLRKRGHFHQGGRHSTGRHGCYAKVAVSPNCNPLDPPLMVHAFTNHSLLSCVLWQRSCKACWKKQSIYLPDGLFLLILHVKLKTRSSINLSVFHETEALYLSHDVFFYIMATLDVSRAYVFKLKQVKHG